MEAIIAKRNFTQSLRGAYALFAKVHEGLYSEPTPYQHRTTPIPILNQSNSSNDCQYFCPGVPFWRTRGPKANTLTFWAGRAVSEVKVTHINPVDE